jgi:hypothetical protein
MRISPVPEVKRTVVRGPGLFRLAVVFMVGIGGAAVLGFLFTNQDNGVYVGGAVTGAGLWLLWTLGISSKVVISDDGIRVDNFFISHIVSWKDFDSFVLDSGIWLTKRDESRIWLVGFGGSFIGALTGYRSFRKKLVILQEAGNRYRNTAGSFTSRDTVRLGLPALGSFMLVLELAAFVGRATH